MHNLNLAEYPQHLLEQESRQAVGLRVARLELDRKRTKQPL
jgi:hypothetical protein